MAAVFTSLTSQTPASDLKRLGWRGVMRTVQRDGTVLVTNHNQPEAVILSLAEYENLHRAAQELQAQKDAVLEELRQEYDKRLAVLNEPGVADRLRAIMDEPARLHGRVIAGASY